LKDLLREKREREEIVYGKEPLARGPSKAAYCVTLKSTTGGRGSRKKKKAPEYEVITRGKFSE